MDRRWMIGAAVLGAMAGSAQAQVTAGEAARDVLIFADEVAVERPPTAVVAAGDVVVAQVDPAPALPPGQPRGLPGAPPAPRAPGLAPGAPLPPGHPPIEVPPARREKVTHLGAATTSAPAAMREQLKIAQGVGLVIDRVEPDSAAEKAGLKQHDLLERLDDQLLINPEQLATLLRSKKPGDEVALAIVRKGERQTVKAKLEEKEVDAAAYAWTTADGRPAQGLFRATLAAAPGRPGAVNFGVGGGGGARFFDGKPVTVRTVDEGTQTTVWADDEVSISLERAGGQTNKLTVTDRKTGKSLFSGPPKGVNELLDARPDLREKVKKAEDAAGRDTAPLKLQMGVPFGKGFAAAGGGGRVVRWQDDDHVLLMRMAGRTPTYLLALSKKDGRTVFDGPVADEDDRRSVPAEIAEEFAMLCDQPEAAQELGGRAPTAKAKAAPAPVPFK